jgi:hypothetical protein
MLINRVITPTTTSVAAQTIRTMHAELADVGLPVDAAEASR